MYRLITRKVKKYFVGGNVGPLKEGKTFLTQLQNRNLPSWTSRLYFPVISLFIDHASPNRRPPPAARGPIFKLGIYYKIK
jgi:hypothetical protein